MEGVKIKTHLVHPLVIEIFENSGPAPRFDLLTRAGSWACSPGKNQEGQKMLGSGYKKNPGLDRDPA